MFQRSFVTASPDVIRRFVMWYEAVAEDNSRSIGMAVSNDGISGWKRWDRSADPPLTHQPIGF